MAEWSVPREKQSFYFPACAVLINLRLPRTLDQHLWPGEEIEKQNQNARKLSEGEAQFLGRKPTMTTESNFRERNQMRVVENPCGGIAMTSTLAGANTRKERKSTR